MAEESVFDYRQGQDVSLFSTPSRPALGPTQCLIQRAVSCFVSYFMALSSRLYESNGTMNNELKGFGRELL
jgi:hypothetical protein